MGVPTSLHVFARNIGVQGLGLRADVGGFAFIFGWTQVAINIEYHLFTTEPVGFYFGARFIGIKISGFELSPPCNEYSWMFGVQAYAGLDLGSFFVEVGGMQNLSGLPFGTNGFMPRVALGFRVFF